MNSLPVAGNSPPLAVVSRYMLAAVGGFVALCLCLLISWQEIHGHFFQPRLLALTHIATLGWITMAIFGAMFQLVPVVLSVPLWSVRLASWQFWIYLAGVLGLVIAFWTYSVGPFMDVAAILLLLAGYLFLYNMLRTLANVKTWDLTAFFLLAALGYFFITITLGCTLALNLGHAFISRTHIDYLKIHAHFGLIGWVGMVIMGVALRLIPMFAIAHGYSDRPGRFAFWLVNTGLLGTMIELTFGATPFLLWIYAGMIFVGLAAYVLQIIVVLKVRMRRSLDVSMRHALVSFAMMMVGAAFAITATFVTLDEAAHERVALAYGATLFVGFMSSLIIGEMYKIIPFLVWYGKYASRAGLEPVPTLKELVHEKLSRITFWVFTGGAVALLVAALLDIPLLLLGGAVFLALASLMFAFNITRIFTR